MHNSDFRFPQILGSVYNKISVSSIITSYVPNGIHTLAAKRGHRAMFERKKESSGPTVVFKLERIEQPNYRAVAYEASRFQRLGKKASQSLGK